MTRSTIICLGTVILAVSISVSADTFLKYRKTTDAHMVAGKETPASTNESTSWIGSKQACYDDGDGHRSIITFATRTMALLNLGSKTYSVMKIDSVSSLFNQAIEAHAGNAEDAAAMKTMLQGMMGSMMKGAMKVTKTDIHQKVGSWQCTKYQIDITIALGTITSEAWLTEQIKVDPASFNLMKNSIMALMPGFADIAKEFEKLKGIPVKTVSTSQMMNSTVTSTELLIESTEKTAPEGIYAIPAGFTKQSMSGDK